MKRVTKKAVATVLTSAMIFTTLLPGNVEPLSAFGSTSEELSVEQLTDFDYDDADLTSDGYFFMKGGIFEYDGERDTGSELAENAVLVTVDSDGNKTEIPSSTAEGRKFTKVVKTYTDGYYNMVVLVNGDERTLVHTNGKYFGGTEQYYDFAYPVSNNMAVVGTDTGETEKVHGKDCPVYELKLIAENGQEFAAGKRNVEGLWSDAKLKGEVGNKEIASVNGSIYVYDTQENTVECFADSTVDISGDYYMIANGTTAALYDKTGSKVMDISGGYRYIKEQKLDTDGYMIVDTASYYTAKQNIISKDGTPWNTTEWENVSKVTMSVVDAGEQTYLLHYEDKKYNKYDYIYDKDGNCLLDIKNEIKTIGKQKGYKETEGACYVAGNNIVLRVYQDYPEYKNENGINHLVGYIYNSSVFAYKKSNQYQNPVELEGTDVAAVSKKDGYVVTGKVEDYHNRKYTLVTMYNEQFEQIPLADNSILSNVNLQGHSNTNSTINGALENEKYVFRIDYLSSDPYVFSAETYRLLDKDGNLTEAGKSVSEFKTTDGTSYIKMVLGDKENGYTTDVYNEKGEKIVSGFNGYAYADVYGPYFCLYERNSSNYSLYDSNGKALMTSEQYKKQAIKITDDKSLLATVYQKDESGNYKYAAVKISSTKTDPDKNGVYVENGEIRYYENGKVNKAYTGMAADSKTGKRYWFDNGVVARDKQVYSPADDAWYWFDADGTMAVGKDVFVPKSNDDRSEGKWVRYDENGHMVKGEDYANGGWYRFDETTGEMAKGFYTVQDGDNTKLYYYNEDTGIMEHGAVNIDGTEYAFDDVTGVAVNNSWYSIDNAPYWYENGVRQGMEGRGKEIYDPASDGWYWLDAVDGGKKAVSKDVYQESYAGAYADREDGTGKWVRYDENGRMIKGWSQQNGNTYYFDLETGAMAKGSAVIDGAEHYFNTVTGVQER